MFICLFFIFCVGSLLIHMLVSSVTYFAFLWNFRSVRWKRKMLRWKLRWKNDQKMTCCNRTLMVRRSLCVSGLECFIMWTLLCLIYWDPLFTHFLCYEQWTQRARAQEFIRLHLNVPHNNVISQCRRQHAVMAVREKENAKKNTSRARCNFSVHISICDQQLTKGSFSIQNRVQAVAPCLLPWPIGFEIHQTTGTKFYWSRLLHHRREIQQSALPLIVVVLSDR